MRKFYVSVTPDYHVARISVRPTRSDLESPEPVLASWWFLGDLRVSLPRFDITVPKIIASTAKFCPRVGDLVAVAFCVVPPSDPR